MNTQLNIKYINCINYLIKKNTQNIDHNDKTFFQHLLNVYNKLRQWNCSEDVCYAGLFHSIYGNNVFSKKIETDREVIKKLVGERCEDIVFNFNKNRYLTKELKTISLANELDQYYILKYDNIFDLKDIITNDEYFREKVPWRFIGSGYLGIWKKFFYRLNFKNKIEKKFKLYTEQLLKDLQIFELLKLKKCYASANPYGTVHQSHKDYDHDSNGGITVMYYLNKEWNLERGGETVFYDNYQEDIFKSIIPKPGRVLIFDGMIEHCARDFLKTTNDLRMVLTFKYDIVI